MAESSPPGTRLKNPWWIPPFLGRVPPGVERRHLSLLGAVAFALMFEEYDLAMITSALSFIAEDLAIAPEDLPWYLAFVRLGAIPALLLIPFADRIGRRRTFLLSLTASALATTATGFAWSPVSFVVFQMLVRTFFVAGIAVAYVLVTEEFPAERRGWGIGMLASLGAMGYGLEALAFSQIEHLPYGWRALYWIGFLPILFLPIFRRTIPETDRFTAHSEKLEVGKGVRGVIEPLRLLMVSSRRRFLGISLCMAAQGFAGVAAFQFTAYYTIEFHGWSPGQYAIMFVIGGLVGIVGNVVAGNLGDRFGRRLVGGVGLVLFPVSVWTFYGAPAWTIPLSWIVLVFTSSAGRMILRAFSTELFDTDRRATATGWTVLLETVFSAAGLFMLAFFADDKQDLIRYIPILALATLAGAAVLARFPETRSRELDSI